MEIYFGRNFINAHLLDKQVVGINGFNFTKDNGYIITGSVVNTPMLPYTNLWLIKTDSFSNDSSNCAIYNSVKRNNN